MGPSAAGLNTDLPRGMKSFIDALRTGILPRQGQITLAVAF